MNGLFKLGALLLAFGSHAAVHPEREFREAVELDGFTIREEMIAMRDGVKLFTMIMVPKNASSKLPILIKRTPYNATRIFDGTASTELGVNLRSQFVGNDFIYVTQDIRGRFKSEGEYVMMLPPIGPENRTETDHTTDAWDTIEWLVNNVESNGKVGVWGTSYPGYLTLAAMKDPHPALAAALPLNPVVDPWKADDWFHWGAFRGLFVLPFVYMLQTRTDEFMAYPFEKHDLYDLFLSFGALGTEFDKRLDERHEMWTRISKNPHYGGVWKAMAADRWFDEPPRLVPTLHVHGWWDQEDTYGSPAVYAAIEKYDQANDKNFFVGGPWYHAQHFRKGDKLGDITFDESTAIRFRKDILIPFLRKYLHGEQEHKIAPVNVFETGENRWRTFDQWPPEGRSAKLYLQPGGRLSFDEPTASDSSTEYVSDPAKPVPFQARPNWPVNYLVPETIAPWRSWLVEDQRFVDGRPDVVTWTSEPLEKDLTVRGGIKANLIAETTGTDADWVVKLIDVYPDPAPGIVGSGYQFMVSGDIFRGRYRTDYENPEPIAPNKPLEYIIPLPHINHTFKAGHRLMVQIQSTLFPLYDRNPQTYVDSIMYAPDDAYQAQRHRIHHDRVNATYLELNVAQ